MGEWIKHDGGAGVNSSYPFDVEVMQRNGDIKKITVEGPPPTYDGVFFLDGKFVRSEWRWARQTSYPWYGEVMHYDVIAYRLHDDGSEAKARESRLEQFRKIANDALIGDKPVAAPKKERV